MPKVFQSSIAPKLLMQEKKFPTELSPLLNPPGRSSREDASSVEVCCVYCDHIS